MAKSTKAKKANGSAKQNKTQAVLKLMARASGCTRPQALPTRHEPRLGQHGAAFGAVQRRKMQRRPCPVPRSGAWR
jgi:hypothetical protein